MTARAVVAGLAVLAVLSGPLAPGLRMPAVQDTVGATTVIAMFRDGVLPRDLDAFAAAHGGHVETRWSHLGGAVFEAASPSLAPALRDALHARGDVRAADLDFPWRVDATPNDPHFHLQWGPVALHLPEVWDTTSGTHAVRVAVLDTGLWGRDVGGSWRWHDDVDANVCGEKNFLGSGHAADGFGHGTHTGGIVAAVTNNALGVAGTAQVCLFAGKICDDQGSCDLSLVGSGLDWALDPDGHGPVDIVSMSFGGRLPSSTLEAALDVAYARGLLLVASAGNDDCGPVGYPAAYDTVVAVGALQQVPGLVADPLETLTGQREVRAPYSNCGLPLELAAPGSGILSTTLNNGYVQRDGTSMAAPFVAGAAALVKSAHPALTNVQLRCVLDQTAEDYGVPKRDLEFGYGKVRPDLALAWLAGHDATECVDFALGLGLGSQTLPVVGPTPPL